MSATNSSDFLQFRCTRLGEYQGDKRAKPHGTILQTDSEMEDSAQQGECMLLVAHPIGPRPASQ